MSGKSLWELRGLDKSRFEAYTKLLRLRNGGQIEEAVDFSEMPDEEEMDSADLDEKDSVNLNPLSQFDDNKLKRAFLDRLSELVANEKGGLHVSSSLMFEWLDRVEILVAKNNGFKENDPSLSLLETIESSLRGIARLDRLNPVAIDTRQNLWKTLVRSYTPRLIVYMSQFKQFLAKTSQPAVEDEERALHDHEPSLASDLEIFRVLVNDILRSSTKDHLGEAVQSAYNICSRYTDQDFEKITGSNAATKSLRNALGFLGRLRTCFNTLVRGAERLSNFEVLRIIPAVALSTGGTKSNQRTSAGNWSVLQTFTSLGLPLDDKTAAYVIGSGRGKQLWTKNQLLRRFDKLKSSVSEVHAEIQVILAAAQHDCTGASIVNYVGCSKRSCFLCFKFVQNYGSFETRGCHGKLYNLWTVPDPSSLAKEQRLKLSQALKHVERDMKASIRNTKTDKIVHAQESTVGGSSIATVSPQGGNLYVTALASQYLRSQREEVMSVTSKNDSLKISGQDMSNEHGYDATHNLPPPELNQSQSSRRTPASIQIRGQCQICEQETSRRCAHCNLGWFCCQSCQDQMPLGHLAKCSARSITTADILYDDALKDEIPKDEQTREHFGFSRCRHWREESHLFGLYRDLLISLGISSIELNKWYQKGILVSKIIKTFSAVPEQSRGGYYPWFLQNQHILDYSTLPPQLDSQNPLLQALEDARPYLDPEDRDKDLSDLEPPAKKHCFLFYAMVLDSSHPNPNWVELDLWYDFGFAVCNDEYGERSLGGIYTKLIGGNKLIRDYDRSLGYRSSSMPSSPTCSFDEFWRAWHNGSLAKVFKKYGLELHGNLAQGFEARHLWEFFSFPMELHRLRPSVWRLKHFLALHDNTPLSGFPHVEMAVRDYGFAPQLDARTKLALRQFYRHFLEKANPLEVDKAKICGELLEYAERTFRDIDNGVRDVLRNLDSASEGLK